MALLVPPRIRPAKLTFAVAKITCHKKVRLTKIAVATSLVDVTAAATFIAYRVAFDRSVAIILGVTSQIGVSPVGLEVAMLTLYHASQTYVLRVVLL